MLGYQIATIALALVGLAIQCHAAALPFTLHNVSVDGVDLFYREAGCADDPLVLLLHGSPDSSFQYRNLLPYLADNGYHVLAPDYPGFGFTVVPESRNYAYNFPSIGRTIDLWLKSLNVTSFSMYLSDYGAPVGFYLALTDDYNIQSIIDQNGAAYTDAFGPGIQPLIDYGEQPNNQTALHNILNAVAPENVVQLYLVGAQDPSMVAPESYTLDNALLAKPGRIDSQGV